MRMFGAVGAVMIMVAPGCSATSAADPGSLKSACAQFGGTVGADQFCQVHNTTAAYDLTLQFPVDYPDQAAVADYLNRRRSDFIDWAAEMSARTRTAPFELNVIGQVYRSGDRQNGTQSLVFTVGEDTGVHPVTTFKSFTYDLADRTPVTLESLFTPGAEWLAVLNPLVRQQIAAWDPVASAEELTADSYRNFAVTDDAIVFYFNQDGLLPHEDGPLEVTVPRSELAAVLR